MCTTNFSLARYWHIEHNSSEFDPCMPWMPCQGGLYRAATSDSFVPLESGFHGRLQLSCWAASNAAVRISWRGGLLIMHDCTILYIRYLKYYNDTKLYCCIYLNDPEWQPPKQYETTCDSEDHWSYPWGAMDGASQGAEYWNERIRITEPFVEAWRLRLQATPSRHGGPRDASAGLRDFLGPLPDMLGISWESVFSNSISFTERGLMSHQSKNWLFLSGMLWRERRKLFANCESLSLVWFWPWLGWFRFDSIRLLFRRGCQSNCTWFNHVSISLQSCKIPQKAGHFAYFSYEYSSCTGHV